MAGLRAVALAALVALVATLAAGATAHGDTTPLSCDGKPVAFHVDRAKALIKDAYRHQRWQDGTPVKDRERRGFQEHKACVRDAPRRERIERFRDRREQSFERHRAYRLVTPYPGPGGTWWAIPFYIVSCESYGGQWHVINSIGAAGPYQILARWERPWPIRSFEDKVEHHRIARHLWTTYGSGQWDCA